VCFEPLEERAEHLEALHAQHPGRLQVLRLGVADVDGALELGVSKALSGSSFAYPGHASRKVPVRRLDSLVREGSIPPAQLVKIDVQGFERRVLEGAASALSSAELVLLTCHFLPFCSEMRTLDDTVAHMSSLGFVPYEFVDVNRRPLDGAMGRCDILFARRSSQLLSDPRWCD
jgi:FkbM family methyltransferase